MDRDSFVFYRSFFEGISALPAKSQGKVIIALVNYALNGLMPSGLSGIENGIFILIKPQIDANNKRYADGQKGGRPKKETNGFENQEDENEESKTSGFENKKPVVLKNDKNESLEKKPNENENVNVNENDNNNIERVVDGKKNIRSIIKEPLTDKEIDRLLNAAKGKPEVIREKYEIAKTIGAKNLMGFMLKAIAEDYKPPVTAEAAKPKNKFVNFEQADWDYEAIERQEREYLDRYLED